MKLHAILEAKYYNNSIDIAENPDRPGFQQQVREAFPDNLLYRGDKLFDLVYDGGMAAKAEQYMKEYNIEHAETKLYDVDSQESYLGYDPKTDTFIQGFDTWPEDEEGMMVEEGTYCTVGYRIKNGNMTDVHIGPTMGRMMYPKVHRQLKYQTPTLLDIRLD